MTSPERILHLLWTGEIGGAERAVYQLVREQMRRGVNVGVAFGQATGLYAGSLRREGCPVIALGLGGGADVTSLPGCIRAMRDYDVHHFHTVEPLTFLASILSGRKTRIFTQRAGVQHGERLRKRIRRRGAGYLLRHQFHAWCGNSPYAADSLSEVYGVTWDSIDVIYNGIEFDLLQPNIGRPEVRRDLGIPENSYVVGTTAVLKEWKRIHLLLEAGAALRGLVLLILGDGPERQRLEGLTDELGIRDAVIFTGMQDGVSELVAAMDVFVLPSDATESFGNSLVEAMALGVPSVVFNDSPGILAHIDPGRTGFAVDDVPGLVDLLRKVREDKTLRKEIGEAGAAAVREMYSIARCADGYERAYRKAAARQRGVPG